MASLLKPLRFRFLNPDDAKVYGEGWHLYDEAAWTQLPARTLMRYEIEIGIPLVDVMDGVRKSSAFGDMAASWLALKLELGDKAIPFAKYNPVVMQIEWEPAPQAVPGEVEDEGKAPATESSEGSASPDSPDHVTVETEPVVLHQLPAAD